MKKFALLLFSLVLIFYLLSLNIFNRLGRPKLINQNPPEFIFHSLQFLNQLEPQTPIFLSGTPVFWLNAFYNIKQIRGGRDEVSVDPEWDKASWEFREGPDFLKTQEWREKLDISYFLIHTNLSKEFYHDFKNISKWDLIGKLIWQERGDRIYSLINN